MEVKETKMNGRERRKWKWNGCQRRERGDAEEERGGYMDWKEAWMEEEDGDGHKEEEGSGGMDNVGGGWRWVGDGGEDDIQPKVPLKLSQPRL
ncbi:uncharacterized protein A4U43_C09F8090 [Asparagus officinalis]|uniref:Uncharacterized protein n=1 Tax=Asparagus officinalis TaxID=4686 RepID=A0A5P1E6B3_ASPOF|nr:uncharacterized protein A4U43_C09F8090 [Asparagus officinalis]